MADESGEKSHDATPHRRQQAREQGQVAYSQDLGSAALLLVGVLVLSYWGKSVIDYAMLYMERQLSTGGGSLTVDDTELMVQGESVMKTFGLAMLPIMGVMAVAGALSTILQIGLLFVPDKIQPDISRLDPLAGLKRIFSLQGVVKLGFGLIKILIVCAVAWSVISGRWNEIVYASELDVPDLARLLIDVIFATALWVGATLFALAILDYGFQRWKHEQDLKMTHQEMREEMKNMQGDPQVISRRRQIQRQMAMGRVGDKVPKADVVVTNPTELAIAIQYDPETMRAPIVLAKGAGVIAQRIRKLALENNIPVVERKPLAQLLYKEVEVNHPIPDQSYGAVAEVLAYVYQLKGKKMPMPKVA
ncbi:flagellar biosynthesis protein FlhB [Lacipirellula parvula]|uniref:Flagellar biosynthetic protein FlhB n=1 Tax=Lacipirellula parvula TaxID=2650471 RepID=A0A5K7XHT4_9BACT|nr:flagellar biosynthesis protein FlhB [Lacipirellula parvula]BBO34521.1 flagellar biosynthesis protein FlhB [Lacipirellula parvula]